MELSPEMRAELISLLREMSPGQLSTLAASLSETDSQIGTSKAGPHYAFLRKLCDWGLAAEVPLDVELPAVLRDRLVSVSINEEAKEAIGKLLKSLS